MKVAILSDVHANLQALTAVLRDCESRRVDEYWLLGDYVDYGASAAEVVALLSSLGAKHIISGNHDACLFDCGVRSSVTPHGQKSYIYTKQLVEKSPRTSKWLQSVADTPMLRIEGQKTLLVHGTPTDPYWGKYLPGDDNAALFAEMERLDVSLMTVGHSHVSFMLTQAGRTIINPGSVGQPRNGDPCAQYAILDDNEIVFSHVPYDIDGAANAIRNAGLPDYLWQRLYVGA
jgi:putative phosphoesterase